MDYFLSCSPTFKSVPMYHQTGNREAKFENNDIFEKPVTLKNPTPPTVSAAHPSNFAQTLTASAVLPIPPSNSKWEVALTLS